MYGCKRQIIKKAESWKNSDASELCRWRTLESLLDRKEIKSVTHKGNQSWIFIRRTDTEAEAPILWPPDVKTQLTVKDPEAWKYWGQEKWATEDEMVGWHHWPNGHKFEPTRGDPEGQGSLACAVHGVTKSQTWLSDWTTIPPTIHELCMRVSVQ